MSYLYDYEAIKLAENKSDWILYFKGIAKHFIKAFSKNYSALEQIVLDIKKDENSVSKELKMKIICYSQLFIGLSPDEDGELNINDEILRKFHRVEDIEKIKRYEEVSQSLNLGSYEFLGESFTLDQLMNLTLSFYHDKSFRKEFFKNIVSGPEEKILVPNASKILPINKISNFNNLSY